MKFFKTNSKVFWKFSQTFVKIYLKFLTFVSKFLNIFQKFRRNLFLIFLKFLINFSTNSFRSILKYFYVLWKKFFNLFKNFHDFLKNLNFLLISTHFELNIFKFPLKFHVCSKSQKLLTMSLKFPKTSKIFQYYFFKISNVLLQNVWNQLIFFYILKLFQHLWEFFSKY